MKYQYPKWWTRAQKKAFRKEFGGDTGELFGKARKSLQKHIHSLLDGLSEGEIAIFECCKNLKDTWLWKDHDEEKRKKASELFDENLSKARELLPKEDPSRIHDLIIYMCSTFFLDEIQEGRKQLGG